MYNIDLNVSWCYDDEHMICITQFKCDTCLADVSEWSLSLTPIHHSRTFLGRVGEAI